MKIQALDRETSLPGFDSTNILGAAFSLAYSKRITKHWWLYWLCALLRSVHKKAAHRHVGENDPRYSQSRLQCSNEFNITFFWYFITNSHMMITMSWFMFNRHISMVTGSSFSFLTEFNCTVKPLTYFNSSLLLLVFNVFITREPIFKRFVYTQ